jgi:thiamine-phosphate pyrophosphorylase
LIRHAIADRYLSVTGRFEVIQVRDKELPARQLLAVTKQALSLAPVVLVNERVDVAIAAGAHGVHLRSRPIPPKEWRRVVPLQFIIGVSCHTLEDVREAEGADYVYFSPIFESPGKGQPVGLHMLREAVRVATMPVIALGGITWDNAPACIEAGAAGIAAIRLFQPPVG